MDKCRKEGRSASESLRAYIEQQIASGRTGLRAAPPRRRSGLALLLAGLAARGLVATALLTLARPSAQATFEALDTNHDHVLSLAEFAPPPLHFR